MKTIQVDLKRASYHYQVRIGCNILKESLEELLQNYDESEIFLVTNDLVFALYETKIRESFPEKYQLNILIIPDGESHKNLETISKIYNFNREF